MKILMIAPQPFFEPRGTPISVYQRLQALSTLQYQVDLLTYHVGQDVSIPGVSVYRGLRVPFIKWVKVGASWRKAFLDILLFCQAIVLLRRNQYDVIHSHEEAAFWSILLSRAFHTRHVYDMHSCLPLQLASTPRWNFWPFVKLFDMLEKWVIHTCDVVITIGVDLEERVMAISPQAKTVLIQNLAVLTLDARSTHIVVRELQEKMELGAKLPVVYTGSFEHYQGLDLLLNSARIVREHYPDILFVMVGGTPQQVEHWRNQSIACGLEGSMLFTGTVPPVEAIAYLDVAEILVSPRTKGTSVPLKIYSYLQSGKPIVATDIVAHSQVLNAEMAVLVAPTAEAFAEGILALARSPELRKRLGLRAQQFASKNCDPADYVTKLERVYQEPDHPIPPSEQAAHSPQSKRARSALRRWCNLH
jgi:glycosyltransferase involved in cell wall biosynthesis